MASVAEADRPAEALLGFRENVVEADGFRIRYLEAGAGDAVVMLHSAIGLYVTEAHRLLSAKHRVILFEVPGFGRSPANERSQTMPDLARTMLAATDALGLKRFNVTGHSFGGRLALWMAIERPDAVASVSLIAAAVIPSGRPPPPATDPVMAKQMALLRRVMGGPGRDPVLEAEMKKLDVPVLALFGTNDEIIPPSHGREYRKLLKHCNVVMIYDAGHALDRDRPEALASVIADFVEKPDGFLVNRKDGAINP
ncbi:MAG TPA: alpha/beta fold hydrolase [Hyphomicrobiales bacterium]|nr:alpha/beta fold hydrolase [Hyphomicrobiales bacterium]